MLYEPDDNDLAKERDCIKRDRDRQVDELVKVSDAFVFERQAHAATRRALAEAEGLLRKHADWHENWAQVLEKGGKFTTAEVMHREMVREIDAFLANRPASPGDQSCTWVFDDGGYKTGCGQRFMFTCEGPAANGARFCQYCGKRLVEVLFSEPGEGEEE